MENNNKNFGVWICCDNGVAVPLSQFRKNKSFCEIEAVIQ